MGKIFLKNKTVPIILFYFFMKDILTIKNTKITKERYK